MPSTETPFFFVVNEGLSVGMEVREWRKKIIYYIKNIIIEFNTYIVLGNLEENELPNHVGLGIDVNLFYKFIK